MESDLLKSRIVFELNEFNVDLLKDATDNRPFIRKLLNMNHVSTKIPDHYSSDFLEPWSQWVSIHTNKSCQDHNIKHLGDIELLDIPHIWDENPSDYGFIWGCLNSKNPSSEIIAYFPDPWTLSAKTNVRKLSSLEAFLRLAVSDRGDTLLKRLIYFSKLLIRFVQISPILLFRIDRAFMKVATKNHRSLFNISSIYSLIEYLSFNIFLSEIKKAKVSGKINIFFANMLAHCQHYYWNTNNHGRLILVLDLIEEMLRKSFEQFEEIVVINGLSQEYSADKEEWNSFYPSIGWKKFIKKYISDKAEVQPCMSYDAIMSFSSSDDLNKARKKANSFYVLDDGKHLPLFLIEDYGDSENRLFIRFQYYESDTVDVSFDNELFEFKRLFSKLATRTARHIQECDVYHNLEINKGFEFNWELGPFYSRS